MGNGMDDLLLRGWMKTERGVGQRVLLLSQEGVFRGWNGKGCDGCADKALWVEGFLFLVYHMAQSLQTFLCLFGLTIWLLPTFSSAQKVSGREAQALPPLRKPLSLPHPKPGIAIGDLTFLICDQSKGALA
jgi:hypothetical protein